MSCNVMSKELESGVFLAELQGDADTFTAPECKKVLKNLIQQNHQDIIVNLDGLDFMDASGLGMLIGALKKARKNKGSLSLICTNRHFKTILDITGLAKLFKIFGNEKDAVKNVREEKINQEKDLNNYIRPSRDWLEPKEKSERIPVNA